MTLSIVDISANLSANRNNIRGDMTQDKEPKHISHKGKNIAYHMEWKRVGAQDDRQTVFLTDTLDGLEIRVPGGKVFMLPKYRKFCKPTYPTPPRQRNVQCLMLGSKAAISKSRKITNNRNLVLCQRPWIHLILDWRENCGQFNQRPWTAAVESFYQRNYDQNYPGKKCKGGS